MVIITVLLGISYLLLCVCIVFFILIQPAKKGGGLGGLGGGAAAAGAITDTLGQTEAEQTLARYTKYGMVIFFVLSLVLTILSNRVSTTNLNLGNTQQQVPAGAAGGAATGGEAGAGAAQDFNIEIPAESGETAPAQPVEAQTEAPTE